MNVSVNSFKTIEECNALMRKLEERKYQLRTKAELKNAKASFTKEEVKRFKSLAEGNVYKFEIVTALKAGSVSEKVCTEKLCLHVRWEEGFDPSVSIYKGESPGSEYGDIGLIDTEYVTSKISAFENRLYSFIEKMDKKYGQDEWVYMLNDNLQ